MSIQVSKSSYLPTLIDLLFSPSELKHYIKVQTLTVDVITSFNIVRDITLSVESQFLNSKRILTSFN
jgi:hypothetical protein